MPRERTTIGLKESIYQHLLDNCRGRSRPARAEDLANKFGFGIRDISQAIRELRLTGILVGSSKEKPFGYYLPITEEEVKNYLDTYKSELFDMLSVYNKQKRARKAHLEDIRNKDLFTNYKSNPAGQLELALTGAGV